MASGSRAASAVEQDDDVEQWPTLSWRPSLQVAVEQSERGEVYSLAPIPSPRS